MASVLPCAAVSILTIVLAILAIGFLIIVHEAGHFIVARWCKMRVDRFSIGFGPPIFSRKYGETDFTIGPIPFGGFVQIHGMLVAEEADPDDPHSYPNRPVWQRFAAIFAGPATNYLTAIVLALLLYGGWGVGSGTALVGVEGVAEGFDAVGKIEAGDVIVDVDGVPVFAAVGGKAPEVRFVDRVQESKGKPMVLRIRRGDQELDVSVSAKLNPAFEPYRNVPAEERPANTPEYRIGVGLSFIEEREHVGVLGTVGHAFAYPFRQTKKIVTDLYSIATDKKARDQAELRSVVGITEVIKKHIELGFTYLLEILMMLNVYLGLFNLFPLPALDGGRLVFLGYEMVTRRRANPKIEATVHMIGIMALMLLLVVVTYKDCARLL